MIEKQNQGRKQTNFHVASDHIMGLLRFRCTLWSLLTASKWSDQTQGAKSGEIESERG